MPGIKVKKVPSLDRLQNIVGTSANDLNSFRRRVGTFPLVLEEKTGWADLQYQYFQGFKPPDGYIETSASQTGMP